MKEHIRPQTYQINSEDRKNAYGHPAFALWFTGLSGSGKSTIANAVEQLLFKKGLHTFCLDGDNLRHGLNRNLGFSEEGRNENLRRAAETAKLFNEAGIIVLAAFVSPLRKDREMAKEIIGSERFVEIYVGTSLETCEKRDEKGLYAKARAGGLKNFTGINAPYEAPQNPAVVIHENETLKEAADKILGLVKKRFKIL